MLDSIDTSIYNLSFLSLPKSQRPILCGIYRITSSSGNVYIGESKNILKRWRSYKYLQCKNQKHLFCSLQSLTPQNHTFEIIELCDFEDLIRRETYWLYYYLDLGFILGESLMNHKIYGVDDKKSVVSDVTRKRISEAKKGKKRPPHTEETKKKNSESHKNLPPFSKQHIFNMSESQKGEKSHRYGVKDSSETCKKKSVSLTGKNNGMFGRVGELNPFFGKSHKEDTINHLRKINIGKGKIIKQYNSKTFEFIKEATIDTFKLEGFKESGIYNNIRIPHIHKTYLGFIFTY